MELLEEIKILLANMNNGNWYKLRDKALDVLLDNDVEQSAYLRGFEAAKKQTINLISQRKCTIALVSQILKTIEAVQPEASATREVKDE